MDLDNGRLRSCGSKLYHRYSKLFCLLSFLSFSSNFSYAREKKMPQAMACQRQPLLRYSSLKKTQCRLPMLPLPTYNAQPSSPLLVLVVSDKRKEQYSSKRWQRGAWREDGPGSPYILQKEGHLSEALDACREVGIKMGACKIWFNMWRPWKDRGG